MVSSFCFCYVVAAFVCMFCILTNYFTIILLLLQIYRSMGGREIFVVCVSPASRARHQKTKSAVVMDYSKYKFGINKSDQMVAYYSFQRKSVKWVVNPHILYNNKSRANIPLEPFYKVVLKAPLVMQGKKFRKSPGALLQADLSEGICSIEFQQQQK